MEPWIETRTGKHFDFLNPKADNIDIVDIATALSNICRFTGHVKFFSVAEHSVYVAARVRPSLRLAALLHDASEAYLGDIASPLKQFLPDYRRIEAHLQTAIYEKFGIKLSVDDEREIKQADLRSLYTEAHYLLASGGKEWGLWKDGNYVVEKEFAPDCLSPREAFDMFMAAYRSLTQPEPRLILEPLVKAA